MRLSDLLFKAGGFKESAYTKEAELVRRELTPQGDLVKTQTLVVYPEKAAAGAERGAYAQRERWQEAPESIAGQQRQVAGPITHHEVDALPAIQVASGEHFSGADRIRHRQRARVLAQSNLDRSPHLGHQVVR